MYEKYARLRDERGLTDYAVSKKTGITTATLSCWKKGMYKPKANKLLILADFFGVSIEYFLKDTKKEDA